MAASTFDRQLDDVDWQLLAELQRNARTSFSEMGRRVGLTPPAVADRIRRMEESGIISGYHAEVNLPAVGLTLLCYIRVTTRGGGACYELGEAVRDFPEVLESHRITGSESLIMKVAVRSVSHLQEVIDRLMPFGETVTTIVLSTTVTHRVVEAETATGPDAEASPRGRRAAG